MTSTRSPRMRIWWPPEPVEVERADELRRAVGRVERVELAVGDREHALAVGLDDVRLVDAGLLHVRRRERRRRLLGAGARPGAPSRTGGGTGPPVGVVSRDRARG